KTTAVGARDGEAKGVRAALLAAGHIWRPVPTVPVPDLLLAATVGLETDERLNTARNVVRAGGDDFERIKGNRVAMAQLPPGRQGVAVGIGGDTGSRDAQEGRCVVGVVLDRTYLAAGEAIGQDVTPPIPACAAVIDVGERTEQV